MNEYEMRRRHAKRRSRKHPRPYATLGSGPITSSLWKSDLPDTKCHYRFNLYRTNARSGLTSNWFRPQDIEPLIRTLSVLAFELAEDGCMSATLRHRLHDLAECLNEVLSDDKDSP